MVFDICVKTGNSKKSVTRSSVNIPDPVLSQLVVSSVMFMSWCWSEGDLQEIGMSTLVITLKASIMNGLSGHIVVQSFDISCYAS